MPSPRFLRLDPLEIDFPGFREHIARFATHDTSVLPDTILDDYFDPTSIEQRLQHWIAAVHDLVNLLGENQIARRFRSIMGFIQHQSFRVRELVQKHHIELNLHRLNEARKDGQTAFRKELKENIHSPVLGDVLAFSRFSTTLHSALSFDGQRRHRGRLRHALQADHGFGPLRCEYSIARFLLTEGCHVAATDLEGSARHDFLAQIRGELVEIECKFITAEKGSPVEGPACNRLCSALEHFFVNELAQNPQSLIVRVSVPHRLPRSTDGLQALTTAIMDCVRKRTAARVLHGVEVTVEKWDAGLQDPQCAHAHATEICIVEGMYTVAWHSRQSCLILGITSRKNARSREDRIRRAVSEGADQLSGRRPGVLFLEIEGALGLTPLQMTIREILRPHMERVGLTRPHLQGVVLGFPGPPFSFGSSYVLRNPAAPHSTAGNGPIDIFDEHGPQMQRRRDILDKVGDYYADWRQGWFRDKQEAVLNAVQKNMNRDVTTDILEDSQPRKRS